MKSSFAIVAVAVAAVQAYSNNVYLIRHGEKPGGGAQGLSPQGQERAQCLTTVFGPSSSFNIGFIMAEQPQSDGDRTRPLMTVQPLATELGLTVDIDCDRDDPDCAADAVQDFADTSSADILICWEHDALTDIAEALGVKNAPDYPDDSFNIIWLVQDEVLVSQTSENCPGLDD